MIVAGLSLRIRFLPPSLHEEYILSGPALMAAIGARIHSKIPLQLITAIPEELSIADRKLLTIIQPDWLESAGIKRMQRQAIYFTTPRIIGEQTKKGYLNDDPAIWVPEITLVPRNSKYLVLANADPRWYAKNITRISDELILLDVHGDWLHVRATEFAHIFKIADIISYNEHNFNEFPIELRAALKGKTCIMKRGHLGVVIISGKRKTILPPPRINNKNIYTDVGAGDLLIGAIGGELEKHNSVGIRIHDEVCEAYTQASTTVGKLLSSGVNTLYSLLES